MDEFFKFLTQEVHLAKMVMLRTAELGEKPALRYKRHGSWHSLSWREFGDRIREVAAMLWKIGVRPGDKVGIFSQNRMEWSLADLAILSLRAVSVPLYATSSADETEYIVHHAEMKVIFVNDLHQYEKAKRILRPVTALETIIVFDDHVKIESDPAHFSFARLSSEGALALAEEKVAAELRRQLNEAASEDLATIIYTSGTTGTPKGVMLTHKNFMAMMYSAGHALDLASSDVSLCVLPLSHVFERSWTYFIFCQNAQNAYCDNPKDVLDYFVDVRPHYMTSVPRIWEKIYANVMDTLAVSSPLKRKIFAWALEVGHQYHALAAKKRPIAFSLRSKFLVAHKLVLSKVSDLVGGRCKSFNCGGAPLAPHVSKFFCSTGVMLAQGYGLTEIFPICVTSAEHIKHGTCGPVVPLIEVRISEAGEIEARGPSCMHGYYKDPEATRQMFTEDGWLKTGDLGHIDADGYVVITDRIKELLITSGGKNISPLKIETLLKDHLAIEQAVALGNDKPYITALIVPAFGVLTEKAKEMGLDVKRREELLNHPQIIGMYQKLVDQTNAHLGQSEQVKKFKLLAHELTQDKGEMTATAKLKRRVIDQNYSAFIEDLYVKVELPMC
jgi:long-chain acyl-CoA synthetase